MVSRDEAGLKPVLARLAAGSSLDENEAEAAFSLIMDGSAGEAQIASLLTSLHMRGETVAEMEGALRAMQARMESIQAPPGAIDVCGTGGDGFSTLNVSTATAFVVAACGVPVAKHGNRALSSRAGGADVLQALGVRIDLDLARLPEILGRVGLVFLFAPLHHPALRHAAAVRSQLGFRTLFNLLGPMANPARVRRQLTGVYDARWLAPVAETLGRLGSEAAWIVHGSGENSGVDELSLAGPTHVAAWDGERVSRFTVSPAEAGLEEAPIASIRGGNAAENAGALLALLQGERGPYRDTVLLNAAAALIVADSVDGLREGAVRAARALDSGEALAVLEALRDETNDARLLEINPEPVGE